MTFDLNSIIESFATEKALLINDLAGELNTFFVDKYFGNEVKVIKVMFLMALKGQGMKTGTNQKD